MKGYKMKKLLISMTAAALILSGCKGSTSEPSPTDSAEPIESVQPTPTAPSPSPDTQEKEFEEIDKVGVVINDYVEATPSPKPSQSVKPSTAKTAGTPKTVKANSDTKSETKPAKTTAPAVKQTKKPVTEQPVPADNNDIKELDNTKVQNKIICIDPGHGIFTENRDEKLAPNSDALKPAYKEGTKGSYSVEDTVTLAVAKKVKEKLEALGATVIMTRSDEYTTMSNIERAEFANSNNADISVKLHADGTEEGGSGLTMLVPGSAYISDKSMLANSKKLGNAILKHAAAQTGSANRGTYTNTQMAGFNWSKVPAALFEMGFMTNTSDEAKLNDPDYQNKLAEGITQGIVEYFN